MLRQLQSAVQRLQGPLQGCLQQLEKSDALRRFAIRALPGQESSFSLDGAVSSGPSSCVQAANAAQPSGQLEARRSMSYAYARKVADKPYTHHEHAHAFGVQHLTEYLIKVVPKWINMAVVGPAQSSVLYQETTVYTTPEHLVPLCYFLRDHVNTQFKACMDITAVDFPEREARFEVVYHLLSPKWNNRIRIKVPVDELTPVPTVTQVWSTANWFERETWDMFGVFFSGHPDLRRILTDYGFTGHPLRKDYPLTGYTEVRYDYGKKRVITEPLELSQEFRYFDFSSPWDTLPR